MPKAAIKKLEMVGGKGLPLAALTYKKSRKLGEGRSCMSCQRLAKMGEGEGALASYRYLPRNNKNGVREAVAVS
jgi:hypothetical protein